LLSSRSVFLSRGKTTFDDVILELESNGVGERGTEDVVADWWEFGS